MVIKTTFDYEDVPEDSENNNNNINATTTDSLPLYYTTNILVTLNSNMALEGESLGTYQNRYARLIKDMLADKSVTDHIFGNDDFVLDVDIPDYRTEIGPTYHRFHLHFVINIKQSYKRDYRTGGMIMTLYLTDAIGHVGSLTKEEHLTMLKSN